MQNWEKPAFFAAGDTARIGLELLCRSRSHIAMFAAGGKWAPRFP